MNAYRLPESSIVLTETDFRRISALILSLETETAQLLENELSRARIVADPLLPPDTVGMHSRVRYADDESGRETDITLVYPHQADPAERKVSILAPVGAALLGLREGQEIEWPFPQGKARRLRVLAVERPAEAES